MMKPESIDPIPLLPESRFEFFNPELDERLLTELTYTSLIRKITQAENLDTIMGKHSQLPKLIHTMLTGGSKIRTITWLDQAGYDFCLGGSMAQNPKWCQPLSTGQSIPDRFIQDRVVNCFNMVFTLDSSFLFSVFLSPDLLNRNLL